MGLVKYALKFRVSFYVLSVLILFLGLSAIVVMPKDVFPSVNIPVVTIIWTYTGLTTPEMEKRVTTYSEYSILRSRNASRPSTGYAPSCRRGFNPQLWCVITRPRCR
jgi:multidrug efflux pump subunit AcrB